MTDTLIHEKLPSVVLNSLLQLINLQDLLPTKDYYDNAISKLELH